MALREAGGYLQIPDRKGSIWARPNLELFDLPSTPKEMERLSGVDVREAAALFLAREHRIPYYFGPQKLARLASHNIEQYLSISRDLFEEMLSAIMLNRTPRLSAVRQHRHRPAC